MLVQGLANPEKGGPPPRRVVEPFPFPVLLHPALHHETSAYSKAMNTLNGSPSGKPHPGHGDRFFRMNRFYFPLGTEVLKRG